MPYRGHQFVFRGIITQVSSLRYLGHHLSPRAYHLVVYITPIIISLSERCGNAVTAEYQCAEHCLFRTIPTLLPFLGCAHGMIRLTA